MRKLISLVIFSLLSISLFSQQNQEVKYDVIQKKFERIAVVNISNIKRDLAPKLQNLEAPNPDGDSYRDYLLKIKQQLDQRYPRKHSLSVSHKTETSTPEPLLGMNFPAHSTFQGVPNDNDCAVSNGGIMVSVINGNMFIYDVAKDSFMVEVTLATWANSLGLPSSKFDPKVMYDPIEDKFVLLCLNGSTDSTSMVVVGFSQTNDPTGNWNLYAIDGNPQMNGTWTDFPMCSMTEKEFFLSINLIQTGISWQLGFTETLIWQMEMASGYSGGILNTNMWSGISFGGKSIRNLTAIRGGAMPLGPNQYFVSNRNFDVANDSVFILEITDSLAGSPVLNVDVRFTNVDYGVPPNGKQKFGQWLATNDGRFLNGFYENNQIQFVGNCIDTATGTAAVYHGFIENVSTTKDVTGKIISDSILDYGYPNISYTGTSASDHQAIITFDHTGTNTFAGFSAMFYDGDGSYSERISIKNGLNYVNVISGVDRWGDYSGSQPKYDEPGTIWVSGTYGSFQRTLGTWIGELSAPPLIGISDPIDTDPIAASTYPNPASERVNLDFEISEAQNLEIALYDMTGRQVELFIRDKVNQGKNRFSFDTIDLESGIYFLRIRNTNTILASKKIVIQR